MIINQVGGGGGEEVNLGYSSIVDSSIIDVNDGINGVKTFKVTDNQTEGPIYKNGDEYLQLAVNGLNRYRFDMTSNSLVLKSVTPYPTPLETDVSKLCIYNVDEDGDIWFSYNCNYSSDTVWILTPTEIKTINTTTGSFHYQIAGMYGNYVICSSHSQYARIGWGIGTIDKQTSRFTLKDNFGSKGYTRYLGHTGDFGYFYQATNESATTSQGYLINLKKLVDTGTSEEDYFALPFAFQWATHTLILKIEGFYWSGLSCIDPNGYDKMIFNRTKRTNVKGIEIADNIFLTSSDIRVNNIKCPLNRRVNSASFPIIISCGYGVEPPKVGWTKEKILYLS